jgi:AcrR family transcriptional regulator
MTAAPELPTRGHRRRARTRAALIEAAREVFAERGVEGATIQQITDAADVAKGSFYNHFGSREEIHRAVAAAALEALGAALDREVEQREADPARVVAASLLCTLRTCVQDPALGGFLLRTGELMELGNAALGSRGRRDLLRGREAGRFVFGELETLLTALAGAGLALLRRRLAGELGAEADVHFVALALRMLGLSPDEADGIADEATQRSPA